MTSSRNAGAFSLIEVVVAVGVVGIAIVAMVALLPALTRQMSDTSDSMVAQRMPAAVQAELVHLANGGALGNLASLIKTVGNTSTLEMVASHDGRQLQVAEGTTLPAGQQYFLIELWQFSTAPLAYNGASGAVLCAYVKVSWPYRLPDSSGSGSVVTDDIGRSSFAFTVAINR